MSAKSGVRLWLRHEHRPDESRTPITPSDARLLVDHGISVTVEQSTRRVFPDADYRAAGCAIAAAGSWMAAPADVYVVGLKELPDGPGELRHRHVFFGHAYKGQAGATRLLRRFAAGGGVLLDLEQLTDAEGRRRAAFGFWAGYVGAALAVLHWTGGRNGPGLRAPLRPGTKAQLDARIAAAAGATAPRAVVNGALGRCGRGAREAFALAGIAPTCWDVEQTRELDRAALLGHEILLNAVLTTTPAAPLVTPADLAEGGRELTVLSDVTCDVGSPNHLLPVYDRTTSWAQPVRRLGGRPRPLDVIAIDNLPSLLPREASIAFSADLVPLLLELGQGTPPWQRCQAAFDRACAANRDPQGVDHG